VAMPDVPPATPPPLVELQSLPPLDPADETGVTPIQTVLRPSRLALSRPRLAGLGVLAFSAGLLTAATAGVVARPARTVAAAQRTPAALANLVHQVKPGARVAIAGIKFFPWWTGPLNLLAWLKNRPYNAKAADLWHPWDRIEAYCQSPLRRWSTQFGMGYIASGVIRGNAT